MPRKPTGTSLMHKLSRYGLAVFYVVAGVNHFINPEFYYDLIPAYFGYPTLINILSGIAELALGALIIPNATRKWATYGIIAMLIAFIPSHIYFVQIGSCVDGGLCVPEWVGWFRLVVIHPLLIYWAYAVGQKN